MIGRPCCPDFCSYVNLLPSSFLPVSKQVRMEESLSGRSNGGLRVPNQRDTQHGNQLDRPTAALRLPSAGGLSLALGFK